MVLSIPITERARKYGYIIWSHKMDTQIRGLFDGCDTIDVVFENVRLGPKRIDWKYRRISVGPVQTRRISPSATVFGMRSLGSGSVEVTCS